jgi:hypothetical protein
MSLPIAPSQLVAADGKPQLGQFQGLTGPIDWSGLAAPYQRGSWWRRFHHKRWHYVALSAGDIFCGIAIVDLGWTNTAFAYVFDRVQRKVIASLSQDGIPGLTASVGHHAGQASRFSFAGKSIEIAPGGQGAPGGRLVLEAKGLSIDASFGGSAPVLLAVGVPEGGAVHATQKSSAMALTGGLNAAGRTISLNGGVASVDYSNGLLARDTAWRWASAHGADVGFNLQAGYFGANENALWLDGDLIPLAAANFAYDHNDPLAPWHVSTSDGLLDLRFEPEGARREDKNLLIAASRYVQPIGTFSGTVRASLAAPVRDITGLVGVTEDHASRW